MKDHFNFSGKVAAVTGGRRGLGRAMAVELARRGAKTAILSKSDEADDVLREIRRFGGEAAYFQVDLARREERTGLMDKVCRHFGRLDILVNNAGYLHCAPVLEYPLAQWDNDMAVLLDAVFELSQQAGRIMVEQGGGGKIIQIGSTAAFKEGAGLIAYATAKSALVGLTRCLAGGLAKHGINVNAIAPGVFNTDINKAFFNNPEAVARLSQPIPSGRFGEVEDIIGPMLFLASGMSGHVHGQTLVVDGGFTGV
ncbi:MAG: SDR family oxidoreductase [Verrucomicrobia bacterium]|nr:SDR family oxidoreductase [Verrucomicrobiota bacterium]MBU4291008.1 SDR family oxidoreductase [Verrucomicrobiota bacterium]MBU4428637.1 SDR family oxidoreductase [Verrucomicrobiota bacterium]MCG2680879.1 SDR family oxidoreductase [Kiritimatiellia bacterium]